MVAGCGAKLAKLLLFIVNVAVWICSVCLMGIGVWMLVQTSKFESIFSDDNMNLAAIIFLCVGSFGFLVGFSGCCGAMKDSVCLLQSYSLLMLLIIVCEITGGVLMFVYQDKVEDSMTTGMTSAIKLHYGEADATTETVDFVQKEFKCCGATDYKDYNGSVYQEKSNRTLALPDSCCSSDAISNTCSFSSGELNTDGCVGETAGLIEDNALVFGLVCFGFVAIEISAVAIACCLISAVKHDEYKEVV